MARRWSLAWLALSLCWLVSAPEAAAGAQQQQQQQPMRLADSATRQSYFGTLIGKLQSSGQNNNKRPQVATGEVYAVDEQTVFIRGFSFDGQAPDTYFWSSVSSLQPSAGSDGFIVPDEKGSTKPLERYSAKDVVLRLPEGKTLREINWLSVWSRQLKLSLADIIIPKSLIIPRPLEIQPLSSLAHGVKSGPITIVDAQTFLVPEFYYDGLGPAGYFWLTRGPTGLGPNGLRLRDENGSWNALKKYQGETVVISLPDEMTIYDYDYFGVWCSEFQVNFGQTHIPQVARVPPSPKMLGIKPENKLNCEILYDDLGFEIRWVLDGDDIVMQLVGKIEPNEYMAFGLGKDDSRSDMDKADAVVAWVDRQTGQVHATDYYLGSKAQCANDPKQGSCPDVKLAGGGDSLTLLHGAIVNGYSMVTFKRPQLGVDEQYDQHVYSDGRQSVIWAIGTLNAHKEVGYHRLRTKANMFIDFARNPQWNCPIPDLNASMHNNHLPITSAASQLDQTVVSAQASSSPTQSANLLALHQPENPTSEAGGRGSLLPLSTSSSSSNQPAGEAQSAAAAEQQVEPWFIPSVVCPSDRTFYAQIGPAGGRRGVAGLTGRPGWGVSWYVNGLMIPELVVERNQAYRFVVEGGNDKTSVSRRHPLYLTDSPEGGFNYKTDDERMKERIFGGVALRPADGQFVPTAEGRLCEWKPTNATRTNPDLYATFSAYQRSLRLDCLAGQAAILKFVPDANTPDQIYYQCYTNRFMGWRIKVVDSCNAYLASIGQPPTAESSMAVVSSRVLPANPANNRPALNGHSLDRRQSTGPTQETMETQHSEPRMSFEAPAADSSSGLDFGDELAASELLLASNSGNQLGAGSATSNTDMLILNNSLLNQQQQQQPFNLSTIEQILKMSPSDVEFLPSSSSSSSSSSDDSQLELANALALSNHQQQLAASEGQFQTIPIPLQNYLLGQQAHQANGVQRQHNKTSISSKMVPKSLHNYMRRLASIYYPVQQQFASMLAGSPNAGPPAANQQQQQQQQQQQMALIQAALSVANQADGPTPAPSSSSFSLASLVPKPKIDLSKSNLTKKLSKLRIKSGRKFEPQQQQAAAASTTNQQQVKRPQPANEINYDIFNNQLAELEKQQRQLQALESMAAASWPPQPAPGQPGPPSPSGDSFNYLPMFSGGESASVGAQESPESLLSLMSDSFQHPNNFNPGHSGNHHGQHAHHAHHQHQPPPRVSATRLGPPTPLGQQPYIVDYMSMGHYNRTEMPPMPPMPPLVPPPPASSHAVFIKRLPYQHDHHNDHQHHHQQQQQHHFQQQPATMYAPNRYQEHQEQAQQHSARYPNIKPYSPPNEQTRAKLSYLDSTDYSNQNNRPTGMSSMPTHSMSVHNDQPPLMDQPAGQGELVESLSGSGSGSHFAFRQQPGSGGAPSEASTAASAAAGDSDHMLAIERFSKQSSERRPPSIVHPVTGEQVIYGEQYEQQTQLNQTNSTAPKRYSSTLAGKHLVGDHSISGSINSSQQQPTGRFPAAGEILDTEQSAQAADLRRLNGAEQQSSGALTTATTTTTTPQQQPNGSLVEAGQRLNDKTLASSNSVDSNQRQQQYQQQQQKQSSPTTESIPSVLLKPTGFDFFASDPPATTIITTTSTPSVLSISSSVGPTGQSPSTGPLVPSMGPPQMLVGAQGSQSASSQADGELVFKSTLVEPITSTLVPTTNYQQLANSQRAPNQFLQNPMNFDSSPFIPIEFAHSQQQQQHENYFQNQQQQLASQYDFRLRPSPLIESMLSQYQSPFRPEPPVQVASYLAQQLAGQNARNLLVSSEKSVASSQPVTMSISLPQPGDQMQPRQSNQQQATSNNDNAHKKSSSDLIILKPAMPANQSKQQQQQQHNQNNQQPNQQTFVLKPEYLTNQFKPMTVADNSLNNGQDQDLSYSSNELSNESPTRRLIGHQFDRLSSLSSPPSTSMALDPMQAAPSSQNGLAASNLVIGTRPGTFIEGDKSSRSSASSAVRNQDSNSTSTTSTSNNNNTSSQLRHIPGKLIPDTPQGSNLYISNQQLAQDKNNRANQAGDNNNNSNALYRDNNTDNAILSHVMSLISSNAIPTPPLIPVASYSSADYFLPISDRRTQRSIRS